MSKSPIRVLQVVGGLGRGGTETWLMNVLRRVDRNEVAMDFLVQEESIDGYEEEARELGALVILCRRDVFWPIRFLHSLGEYGSYDIVHSHRNNFSAFVLLLSRIAGVRTRIAHSHNDFSESLVSSSMLNRVYLSVSRRILGRVTTCKLAVSKAAEESLFGRSHGYDDADRPQIVYCGIDLDRFGNIYDRDDVRSSLGISRDEFVVGHIGGFRAQKNHRFVIEVFKEFISIVPHARLILIGVGPLLPEMIAYSKMLGLQSKVSFLGSRNDVPALLSAMDVFLFPSLHEGLPLVLMETQASSVPALVSDAVSHEIEYVDGLISWFGLSSGASAWARTLYELRQCEISQSVNAALTLYESPFDIRTSVSKLLSIYMR